MNMLRLLMTGSVVCALSAGAGAAADKKPPEEKKADNKTLIIGSWEAVKVEPGTVAVGTVVTFKKDGKVTCTPKIKGKLAEYSEGTYTVDSNKFTLTLKAGGKTETMVVLILKLDNEVLLTKNDLDRSVEFKRKK